MKKGFQRLTVLVLINLSACNHSTFSANLISPDNSLFNSSARKAKNDWFENLRPELQQYYAPARGKTGADLFDTLREIISKDNKITSYSDSKAFMISTLDNITLRKKAQPGIIDVYSQIFIPGEGEDSSVYKENEDANKDGYANDVLNCEHTWPQSFYGKSLPMVADLHHLEPTLFMPNRMRSDFPFGTATDNVVYSTIGGSKLAILNYKKINAAAFRKKLLSGTGGVSPDYDAVFEPADPQKGNTARAMLYFYLRYNNDFIRQGSYDKNTFWASKVSTFMKWSEVVDPVNDADRKRNEMIFQKQGNRNPFIDVPEFASLIGEDVFKAK